MERIILKINNKNNKRFLLNYIKNNYKFLDNKFFEKMKKYDIKKIVYFCNINMNVSIYFEN